MITSEHLAQLAVEYGEPIRTEQVPCKSEVNEENEPYVGDDGRCCICGEQVEFVQFQDPHPNLYSRRALPHERWVQWHAVSSDDLHDLRDEISWSRGGGDWLWDVRNV